MGSKWISVAPSQRRATTKEVRVLFLFLSPNKRAILLGSGKKQSKDHRFPTGDFCILNYSSPDFKCANDGTIVAPEMKTLLVTENIKNTVESYIELPIKAGDRPELLFQVQYTWKNLIKTGAFLEDLLILSERSLKIISPSSEITSTQRTVNLTVGHSIYSFDVVAWCCLEKNPCTKCNNGTPGALSVFNLSCNVN